jgi:hypothetical protein
MRHATLPPEETHCTDVSPLSCFTCRSTPAQLTPFMRDSNASVLPHAEITTRCKPAATISICLQLNLHILCLHGMARYTRLFKRSYARTGNTRIIYSILLDKDDEMVGQSRVISKNFDKLLVYTFFVLDFISAKHPYSTRSQTSPDKAVLKMLTVSYSENAVPHRWGHDVLLFSQRTPHCTCKFLVSSHSLSL